MKRLQHRQEILVEGFVNANKITVTTLAGVAEQEGESLDDLVDKAIKFNLGFGPWTIQLSRRGSLEASRKKKPTTVKDGDLVEIEEELYLVKVGEQSSDNPVTFTEFL